MSDVPSEKTQAKAAEYLLAGLVKVQKCEKGDFLAHVYSATQAGEAYWVKFTDTGWHCDCPARVQVCAHVLACQTITEFGTPAKADAFQGPQKSLDEFLEGI